MLYSKNTMVKHLKIGKKGEQLALLYLQTQGYDILARNFKGRSGEIDLVAYEGDCVVFVEVKTRNTLDYGRPAEAVDPEKQRALRRAADEFRASHNLQMRPYRFDIVSILVTRGGPEITLHRNAF